MTSTIIAEEINDQTLGNNEGLVSLYDLTIGGTTYYFHGEDTHGALYFKENNYYAFPILLEGIEVTGDGAQVRPTLTLPNVNSLFKTPETSDYVQIDKLEDLVGGKVTRHQTLSKYVGIGENVAPENTNGYELPKATYIIDRVASKNRLMIQLELASPFDLSGVRVPSRQVTGKYCVWYYKGYDFSNTNVRSACTWTCKSSVKGAGAATFSQNNGFQGDGNFPLGNDVTFLNVPATAANAHSGATFDLTMVVGSTNAAPSLSSIAINKPGRGYSVGDKVILDHSNFPTGTGGAGVQAGSITLEITQLHLTNGSLTEKFLFFSIDDEPFVLETDAVISNASTWGTGSGQVTSAQKNDIVLHNGIYYMAKTDDATAANTPTEKSIYWKIIRTYKNYSTNFTTTINAVDSRRNTYIYHDNNIWRAINAGTKANLGVPSSSNKNYAIADICSKLLSGCKARFQATIVKVNDADDSIIPSVSVFDSSEALPFGGFPGTRKYR